MIQSARAQDNVYHKNICGEIERNFLRQKDNIKL
jgi:hypothetical protein